MASSTSQASSPATTPAPATNIPQRPRCCCGLTSCPFLAHNGLLVEGLERDVRQAAKLGQALLVRHETYIADSEAERRRMAANIERLEMEKTELEAQNARTVRENRDLLDQLERLNNAVAESDAQVQSLTATLLSTQCELTRLTNLAARTETLERQLSDLERDQAQLQDTLATTKEEERSAIQRWRKAERTIADLYDQMERIEREAKQERDRHEDVVARMERRRQVEKELEAAAGRLKGAAATKTAREGTSNQVVSHFVKDILQDNANLQLGIVELREMLSNSNEEVERLREQLMLHQPLDEPAGGSAPLNLRAELGVDADPVRTTKELHVHHHYHAPRDSPGESAKTTKVRKPKAKRKVMTPHHFSSASRSHTPHSSISSISAHTPSSTAAILSQTSVSIPSQQRHAKRFSVQSTISNASFAPSSVPTSPFSNSNRTSSIFDRIFSDAGQESSRPTSPESNDPGSPTLAPLQTRPRSSGQPRSVSTPTAFKLKSKAAPSISLDAAAPSSDPTAYNDDTIEDLDLFPTTQSTIPEEPEHNDGNEDSADMPNQDIYARMHTGPSLRRAASHESLLSVRGLDLHTYTQRGSAAAHFLPSSTTFSTASASLTATAAATAARPTLSRHQDSSAYYRSLLSSTPATGAGKHGKDAPGGKRTGRWLFGKWGSTPFPSITKRDTPSSGTATPSPSPASLHPSAPVSPAPSITTTSTSASTAAPAKRLSSAPAPAAAPAFLRPPGVNQAGPIFGLGPEPRAPFKVVVGEEEIDVGALREGLGLVEGT